MSERFIVDTAGTLIDMETRDSFDYVSDVCPVLNKYAEENEKLKQALREELEDNGNAYTIEIMDKLFKLDYDKWDEICDWDKRCPYDWEEMVK